MGLAATCRHNNRDYVLKTAEYTNEENFEKEFNEKGYVFLENVVNIEYDFKQRQDYNFKKEKLDVIENFFPDTKEYHNILTNFKASKIFNIINKNFKDLRLYNFMCFRLYKNASCSGMHRDDDLAIIFPTKTPFIICWMPLLNVPLGSGPLAVVGKTVTQYSQQDIDEGKKYVDTFLKKDDIMENIDSIRNALNCGLDYQRKNTFKNFDTIVTRDLKKGDAVIMNHDVLHGSLDQTNNLVRSSIDLRFFYNADSQNNLLKKVSLEIQ